MTEPIISILFPTIRPEQFRIRMAEYAKLVLPGPCEVVVVSDGLDLDLTSPQPLLTIRHLRQSRQGNVPATNYAFQEAKGLYVFATNDEVELDSYILNLLFRASLLQAVEEGNGGDGIFSASQTPYCSNDYYEIYFANCPFGKRSFFQQLNGSNTFFDPVYRCFYADPDLSIRAHLAGFPVVKVPEAKCTHHCVPNADGHVANNSLYYHADRQTFITRWAHLGPPPVDPSMR